MFSKKNDDVIENKLKLITTWVPKIYLVEAIKQSIFKTLLGRILGT